MKKKQFLILLPIGLIGLSSCSALKAFEHEITVTYMYNGKIIASETVNEFTNAIQPTLNEKQIPVQHEFYGWTWLDPNRVSIKNEYFSEQYVAYDEVLHYSDIKDHVFGQNITLNPVFVNENDIPIPDYYVAIGWYDKVSTSGLTQEIMTNWEKDLKNYLKNEGATDEDLSKVYIKGYQGDVATAGSLINKDRFVDILLGFGKNIGSTGGVLYKENVEGITMGNKSRYITRLTDKDIALKVFSWLQTSEGNSSLAG